MTPRHPLINTSHPVAMVVKRALFVVFGIPLMVAIGMSLVDSYRRRGKKPKPFPTRTAQETQVGDGDGHDVHLRPGPVRRHARRHRGREEAGPARDLHLEGRRGRPALQEGAHRRGRPGCRGAGHLRPVRQHRRAPAVQALPAEREGARLPRLLGRLAVLRPAPLRPRPPQDPRRRRRGRLRRRLQHRLALRHRVARHALPDHRAGRLGPARARSPTSGTCTATSGSAAASRRC